LAVLTLSRAQLAYGHWPLLDDVDFELGPRERVGLIGRNGTGKSSLLHVLAGAAPLDDGEFRRASGLRVAHVAQEPVFADAATVYDTVAVGLGEAGRQLADYHHATIRLAEHPGDSALLRAVDEAQARIDAGDGWTLGHRVDNVLDRLGLAPDAPIATLSGGWQKRTALAQALAADPDVLLLDEPTNHLDLAAIGWLEDLLLAFDGAVVCITHDRRFLDTVATRIVELDRGRLASYPGNYAAYEERKARELADEAAISARADKLLAQEEVWIRKGIEARRTRNEGRVRRLESLRRERALRRERLSSVELRVAAGERSGKLVAELEGVCKRFGPAPLIERFSTRIIRGDRIGLIGPNGAGKSTLLKLILGELEPDAGQIRRGSNLAVAYYDQLREALDPEWTLAQAVSPGGDWVEVGSTRRHVVSYLGDFLFPAERIRSPVRSLSGGERNRLLLARLFTQPANVLVLDEPTNDLDIDTLELLEDLLCDYEGTLFVVSHDRAFLDNVVTQSIVFEGGGRLREFAGGYADWMAWRDTQAIEASPTPGRSAPPVPASPRREPGGAADLAAPRMRKLSPPEERELAGLPASIEALEQRLAALRARLADPAIYREAAPVIKSLHADEAALDAELAATYARWETLEARLAATRR
jgi:ATP-binding cassette subfamily F protein uup